MCDRKSLEVRQEGLCTLLVFGRDKDHDFVCLKEFLERFFGRQLFADIGQDVIKVTFFNHFNHDVESTLKHSLDVDLRDSGPLGVELDPLADPLITKHIKRL